MSGSGWIKLHRSIMDHWVWEDKPFSKGQAWIDLLMQVNHTERKVMLGNELVTVERGAMVTSIRKLCDRWGWSNTKVRNFLRLLEQDGMLEVRNDTRKTVLKVRNYDVFQARESDENDTKTTPERRGYDVSHHEDTQKKRRKNDGQEQSSNPHASDVSGDSDFEENDAKTPQKRRASDAKTTPEHTNKNYKNERNIVVLPTADLETVASEEPYNNEAFREALEILEQQAAIPLTTKHWLQLTAYKDDLPGEVIKYACEQAVLYNITGRGVVAYVVSILDRYVRNGITTLEEAKEDSEKFQRAKEKEQKKYDNYNWRGSNRSIMQMYRDELIKMFEEEERQKRQAGEI